MQTPAWVRPEFKLGVFSMPAHPPHRDFAEDLEMLVLANRIAQLDQMARGRFLWEGDNRQQWRHSMELLAKR